jgi:hypothetical protein
MGSESAREDMDETTPQGNACQNDEMRFSLQVVTYGVTLHERGGTRESR